MKRSFLIALGLEKPIIDQIMDEHGNTLELTKEKSSETIEDLKEKNGLLQTEITELKATPPTSGDGYKEKYETLEGEFATYKAGAEKKKTEDLTIQTVKAQLLADGANPKFVSLLIKEFDLTALTLEGDEVSGFTLKDWETIAKPVKESYVDLFGKVETHGAHVPTPPAGSGGTKNPWLKENRNIDEQTRIYREDPVLAQSMARAAGVDL